MFTTRDVTALKVHCPVDPATFRLLQAGEVAAIDPACALAAIMAVVRGDNPLGDFGLYTSVMELSAGWELFTSSAGASPTLGRAGADSVSPTAILTIHIPGDVAEAAVMQAIDAIMAAHPWEVPVVEITRTALVVRG